MIGILIITHGTMGESLIHSAAHVLNKLDPQSTVGLVRFPSVQPPIQNRRLNLQHTDQIVDWNGKDCDAPDMRSMCVNQVFQRKTGVDEFLDRLGPMPIAIAADAGRVVGHLIEHLAVGVG